MAKNYLRVVLTAALLAMAVDGSAQERSGLMGGVSVGAGVLGIHGTTDDPGVNLVRQHDSRVGVVSFDARLGAMAAPNTGLLFVLSADFEPGSDSSIPVFVGVGNQVVAFDDSTTSLGSWAIGGAIQQWVASKVWLRGGVGGAFLSRDFTQGTDESYLTITLDRGLGVALFGGAGFEFYRRGIFAADIQFHFTGVILDGVFVDSPAVRVGVNWY